MISLNHTSCREAENGVKGSENRRRNRENAVWISIKSREHSTVESHRRLNLERIILDVYGRVISERNKPMK